MNVQFLQIFGDFHPLSGGDDESDERGQFFIVVPAVEGGEVVRSDDEVDFLRTVDFFQISDRLDRGYGAVLAHFVIAHFRSGIAREQFFYPSVSKSRRCAETSLERVAPGGYDEKTTDIELSERLSDNLFVADVWRIETSSEDCDIHLICLKSYLN